MAHGPPGDIVGFYKYYDMNPPMYPPPSGAEMKAVDGFCKKITKRIIALEAIKRLASERRDSDDEPTKEMDKLLSDIYMLAKDALEGK